MSNLNDIGDISPELAKTTAVIAASGTTSGVVDMGGNTLVAILTPAALTGTTLTFTACDTSGGTFLELNDITNTAISVTIAASSYIVLDDLIGAFSGVRFLKLVSGSTEAAERTFTLVGKPI